MSFGCMQYYLVIFEKDLSLPTLVVSMTEPPPTATKLSQPLPRAKSIALFMLESLGSTRISSNTVKGTFCLLSDEDTVLNRDILH